MTISRGVRNKSKLDDSHRTLEKEPLAGRAGLWEVGGKRRERLVLTIGVGT